MKETLICDWCGKEIRRYKSQIKKHNFCSRSCLGAFSSRTENPKGYSGLKNYENMRRNMAEVNRRMNPHRMTPEVRAKLRAAHLGSGEGKGYEKTYGIHTHRRVAEKILGRKLRPGETVHHKDRKKRNNSPSNLQVFSSQSEHVKYHAAHDKEVIA